MGPLTVYGAVGSGSVAIEAALTLAGADFLVEETPLDIRPGGPNPLAQVPALRLPDGTLLTESCAILLWVAETWPAANLAPPPGATTRAPFLRWMAFVAALYALYWVRDEPGRVTDNPAAQRQVRDRLNARIAHAWGVMEQAVAPGDFLLGDTLTVLDLYTTVVSRWTPRRPLHERIAPRLGAVARRVEADPRLANLWRDRFPLKAEG